MIFILIVILSIYFILSAVVIGTDMVVSVFEKYSHFHMGKWDNVKTWRTAVLKICKKWAIRTPVLRLKKDCRYILLDRIRGKYGKTMVQSWQKAGCLLGLEFSEDEGESVSSVKKQLIAKDGNWKKTVNKVDYSMMAFALLKQENDPDNIRKAMDQMFICIESNLCDDGMVSYSAGKQSSRRYVDTLGFICPFLGLYGKTYNKPECIELAFNQILLFRKKGMISGLPVHCFESKNGLPIGICGWGRGTGWYTLAIIDLYPSVSDKLLTNQLKEWILEAAESIKRFERTDGGFSTVLAADSPYDSSSTAMIGYFYAQAGKIFDNNEYLCIAKNCVKRLMKVTKLNGAIDECQGDTIDIGIFSERYSEMPFAQGMALRLINTIICTTGE